MLTKDEAIAKAERKAAQTDDVFVVICRVDYPGYMGTPVYLVARAGDYTLTRLARIVWTADSR